MSGARLLDYWSPPDGAGAPVACLATSFTFEADFFAQDCLSRFLSLSTIAGEGDSISSIAAMLEEEERLSECQVSVLVDRSSPAEKRNLRWDVIPVVAPGGLLHAKLAVLLWERAARIVLGSANLTSAGYRRQVEAALAIDLDQGCQVPRALLDDLVGELRSVVELAAGPATGAKGRALATVELLAVRIDALDPPGERHRGLRLAVASARPGVCPLDRLADVWRGPQPLRATWLSPFWDDQEAPPALEAVRRRLTGRPASRRATTLVVAVDPFTGVVQAPASLASHADVNVVAFDPPDTELRTLHAKVLLIESDEWLAALIGSSNATEAGFGLHRRRGHHELNLWLGCPASSRIAEQLRSLVRAGERIGLTDERWEPPPDEDEPTTPDLPLGFLNCVIEVGPPASVLLGFDLGELPDTWQVQTPTGQELVTAHSWRSSGSTNAMRVPLLDETLPSYLLVRWKSNEGWRQATWTANVDDRSSLPPPAELADLPVEILLAALASTRPLPVALEHELRRRQRVNGENRPVELDPLRRFDDRSMLLHRTRHVSLALWRLQDRLERPATSVDAVRWRLHGTFGPLAIADGLVKAAHQGQALPGEPHFVLAELALTLAAVDWSRASRGLASNEVGALVAAAQAAIVMRCDSLPPAPDAALEDYVRDAFEAART